MAPGTIDETTTIFEADTLRVSSNDLVFEDSEGHFVGGVTVDTRWYWRRLPENPENTTTLSV